jgi:hypothetical protein
MSFSLSSCYAFDPLRAGAEPHDEERGDGLETVVTEPHNALSTIDFSSDHSLSSFALAASQVEAEALSRAA